jgi:hypothetical protein
MPVNIPLPEPIVVTAVLLLVHIPDPVLLNVAVLPTHTGLLPPVIADGRADTVIIVVEKQPDVILYVIIAVPDVIPVTVPELPAVATEVLLLV